MKNPATHSATISIPQLSLILLTLLCLALFCRTAQAQPIAFSTLFSFTNSTANGSQPVASLVVGLGNALYGTTYYGGANNLGGIFRLNLDGSGFKLIHGFTSSEVGNISISTFNPNVGSDPLPIVQGPDGMIYGACPEGGANGNGMIYKIFPDGSGITNIHNFIASDGYPTALIMGSDGALYGAGFSIFRLTTDGNTYQALHVLNSSSDGRFPYSLTQGADGMLYGVDYGQGTNSGGTLFKAATNGSSFSVLRSFPNGANDASRPTGITQGSDGFLYGVSFLGGSNSVGTVFKSATDGSGYQVLYHFLGGVDGSFPFGRLLQSGNLLYGTTKEGGGAANVGTIFKISTSGGAYGTLYSFPGGPLQLPFAGLTQGSANQSVGILYGAVGGDGSDPIDGAVFAMLLNPPLSITPVAGQAVSGQSTLFWPAWAAGFTLQSTTNPVSGNWVNVTNAIPVLGVQVTNNLPANYYRLVFP